MLNLSIRSSAKASTHVVAGLSRPSYSRYVGTQVAAGSALTVPNKETSGTIPDATASSTAFTNGKPDKATTLPSPALDGATGLKDAVADITSGGDTAEHKVPGTITLKNCQVAFLDEVKIVGENDNLGAWAVDDGIRMQWTEGHDWVAELDLSPDLNTFKMVIVHADGSVEWEKGINRELQVPVDAVHRLAVECQFNNTAETTLVM